jgi:hypothetical protein
MATTSEEEISVVEGGVRYFAPPGSHCSMIWKFVKMRSVDGIVDNYHVFCMLCPTPKALAYPAKKTTDVLKHLRLCHKAEVQESTEPDDARSSASSHLRTLDSWARSVRPLTADEKRIELVLR